MATRLNMLSEDCISTILSLTSPPDACRFMLASSSLRSAAESDITFSLNKISGRKSYVLSARALSISLINEANHWTWTTHSTSRFSEVIELKTISNMEIEGRIGTQDLSPNTTYGVYLIIKVSDSAFGLDSIPSETSISKHEYSVTNTAYLCPLDDQKQQFESLFFMNRRRMMEKRVVEGEGRRPSKRGDEWLEVELGEFFVGGKSEMVKMSLMEVKGHQLKGGLIIEGIEIRPKC
ncbi:hypothetical protein L1987_20099 [Smallanthus sonchifolius]|uniref:Uncharacterized protein n=1 Tax=Smallanthus sonchifolius TaxID=185202 RepID=A0ACB9ISJ7_9ASTR|nr:hypothetical protein L1987_20099 [Smallanthus sonchifolius]